MSNDPLATVLDPSANTHPAQRGLVLDLLGATLDNDEIRLNGLLAAADPDDARWAAACMANVVALHLQNQHGHAAARGIIADHAAKLHGARR